MSLARTFTLHTGAKIPALGLGTWQSEPGQVRASVATAIGAGYRHLDCAWIYGQEKEVGEGIKESKVPREKLWITSKLWNGFHHPENVEAHLDDTLKRLQVSYLDLYLMHWPVAFQLRDGKPSKFPKGSNGKVLVDQQLTEDVLPTWRAMEALVEKGKVKHIGISNFNIRRTKKLLEGAKIKPAVNQVELNFANPQPDLVAWCQKNGIVPQSYSPLGSTGAAQREEKVIVDIAKKLGVDPAQVLISWQIQRGAVCLPKSVTASRIKSNFEDVIIPDADFKALEQAATSKAGKRTLDPSESWGVNIYEDQTEQHNDKIQAKL